MSKHGNSNKKKIVKLSQQEALRKPRPKVRFRRALFSFAITIAIIIVFYFSTSISRLGVINFDGLNMLTRSELINLAGISHDELFLGLNTNEIAVRIKGHPAINDVTVTRYGFNRLRINVTEYTVSVCALIDGETYHLLTDGRYFHEDFGMRANCDGIMVHGLTRDELDAGIPSLFATQWLNVDFEIRNLIRLIEHDVKYGDMYRFSLSLVDGNTVKVTTHSMPESLSLYREIISAIEPGVTGILHLDVGISFIPHD